MVQTFIVVGKLATGSADNTAGVWDAKSGLALKKISRRSAFELFGWMPLVDVAGSFSQILTFAFSDEVPWNRKTIAPVASPLKLSLFDFHLPSISTEVQF